MDKFTNQLSQVSLYDVKKYVRKAQNSVLNFTDMEAKVREATNNEPWGTSTTVMYEIAEGTNDYNRFHEIMRFLWRRFSEKSASEWRQIYKSLQLLDFLVLNGSERVVDYTRSHISVIEMLRHFSYVDSRGADQGVAIRKRAEDLLTLLNSDETLRIERKKAKKYSKRHANQPSSSSSATTAYSGTNRSAFGSGGGYSGGRSVGIYANDDLGSEVERSRSTTGTGSRYGGFSNDEYRSSRNSGPDVRDESENGEDDDDFEEYQVSVPASKGASSGSKSVPNHADEENGDDDFADFQSAPTSNSITGPATNTNILDLFNAPMTTQISTTSTTVHAPLGSSSQESSAPPSSLAGTSANLPAKAAPQNVDLFDSLWESSKTSTPQPALKVESNPASALKSSEPSSVSVSNTHVEKQPHANDIDDLLSF